MPTRTAVGVARPMAQGQAMTTTAIALSIAPIQSMRATQIHPKKVTSASPMTIGTKYRPISSVSFWIGALLACAS